MPGLFIHTLADKLGVGGDHVQPGYEDTFYYLWRERRLPVNVGPLRCPPGRRDGAGAPAPGVRPGAGP